MAEPTYEEMKARLAELAERMNNAPLHFRVAQKGGVSVYGISRFPITLSYAQWVKLLEATPQLRAFMEENKSKVEVGGCVVKGHVGFTGTQLGGTPAQLGALRFRLQVLRERGAHTFHHGDCVGADAQAHVIATESGYGVEIHPPDNPTKRARMKAQVLHPMKPYLMRNRDIVDASEVLLAVPRTRLEELRSGTWATIRYARKRGVEVHIIYPEVAL